MVGIAVADSESLRATNSIDTPEESPASGTTVNHIGVFEQGEQIEATVTGPDETYDIGLFDSSDTEIANQSGVSNTVAFDSTELSLEPGSYMLSVTNTPFEYVAPIVISGYNIEIDLTEDTTDDELSITATVSETAVQGAPHAVNAVVWNENAEEPVELTTHEDYSSSAEYDGTVSIADIGDEPYNVYVVATSDKEIYQGKNEILGIGEVSVDPQDESDDGTNGSDNSDDGTDDSDNSDNNKDSNGSDSISNDEDNDSSVIEPNTSTDNTSQVDDEPERDIDDETPLPVSIPIIALLLTAVIFSKRVQK